MKKIASILAEILMIAMLAGCSLVAVNPDKIVVASIGEKTISKTEFDAYLNAYLSTYGYTVESPEIAEQLTDLKTSMIEVLVEEAVIADKIAELSPRFENNKSLIKCYGTVDRPFAEALLGRLFSGN